MGAEFVESKNVKEGLPEYAFAAFRVPEGKAIVGSGPDAKEGVIKNREIFVPFPLKPADDFVRHLRYLSDAPPRGKGYEFLGFGNVDYGEKEHKGLRNAVVKAYGQKEYGAKEAKK